MATRAEQLGLKPTWTPTGNMITIKDLQGNTRQLDEGAFPAFEQAGYTRVDSVDTSQNKEPEKTVGDILGYIPQNNTDYETAVQDYKNSLQTKEMTEEEIRQKTQERMQAQIDALDRYYAEQIARENVAGQGRLGESSAIQARRGLIGSDFGQAQTATTITYNEGVLQGIEAEKQAKIQNILSEGRKDVVAEATAKLEAKKAGAKEYLTFLAGEQDRKTARVATTVSNLVNAGIEPTDEDLKALATQLGVSVQELKAQYNAGKKAKKGVEVSAGASYIDPETGKVIYQAPASSSTKPETIGNTEIGYFQYNPTDGTWKNIITGTGPSPKQDYVTINGQSYKVNPDGSLSQPDVPTDTRTQGLQFQVMDTAIAGAEKFADAAGRSKWAEAIASGVLGATDYTKLQSYANSLKTNLLTLASDPNVKKFFGPQMSNADVKLMMAGGTTLDPELQGPKEFKEELTRVKELMERMKKYVPTGTSSSTTRMKGPDGLIYDVPNNQVEAFIADGGQRFNNVGGDTYKAVEKTIDKAKQVSNNTSGGQCGSFVKKVAGIQMGDKYEEKLAKMDKTISSPKPGMVFVMPYSWTGHTGVILDIKDGIATVKHSNFNLDEKVTTDKIPVTKMTGFAYPKLS